MKKRCLLISLLIQTLLQAQNCRDTLVGDWQPEGTKNSLVLSLQYTGNESYSLALDTKDPRKEIVRVKCVTKIIDPALTNVFTDIAWVISTDSSSASPASSCHYKGYLFLKRQPDAHPLLFLHLQPEGNCKGVELNYTLTKNISPEERKQFLANAARTDSLNKSNSVIRAVKYLACEPGFIRDDQRPRLNEFKCEDLNFTLINNSERIAGLRLMTWNYSRDRSMSEKSLCKNENNIYNSKILGTWHSADYTFIYQLKFWDRSCPKILLFIYSKNGYYYPYYDVREPNCINFTHVDTTLYYEFQFNNGKKFIPSAYWLKTDNELLVKQVSAKYYMPDTGFYSVYDYRNYFESVQTREDFFFNPITLYRMTPDDLASPPQSLSDIQQKALRNLQEKLAAHPSANRTETLAGREVQLKDKAGEIAGYDKFWNPLYGNYSERTNLYFDKSGYPVN